MSTISGTLIDCYGEDIDSDGAGFASGNITGNLYRCIGKCGIHGASYCILGTISGKLINCIMIGPFVRVDYGSANIINGGHLINCYSQSESGLPNINITSEGKIRNYTDKDGNIWNYN